MRSVRSPCVRSRAARAVPANTSAHHRRSPAVRQVASCRWLQDSGFSSARPAACPGRSTESVQAGRAYSYRRQSPPSPKYPPDAAPHAPHVRPVWYRRYRIGWPRLRHLHSAAPSPLAPPVASAVCAFSETACAKLMHPPGMIHGARRVPDDQARQASHTRNGMHSGLMPRRSVPRSCDWHGCCSYVFAMVRFAQRA